MNRKYINKLSIRSKNEDFSVYASPNPALIISKQDAQGPKASKKLNDLPKLNLTETINDSLPLSQVSCFAPNEVTPAEVKKSENPSVCYFFERAYQSSQKQEYTKSISFYKKVLACEANHFESCVNIGVCMMKLNMFLEAIASFDSALKANKPSFTPYFNKALAYLSLQNYTAALQCMETASQIFPDPPEELQKIRTFAIFKSGKIAYSNRNEDKESPVSKIELRPATPAEPELVQERVSRRDHRKYTEQKSSSKGERPINLINVQDFDERSVRTATITQKKEASYFSASPYKTSRSKQSQFAYNYKKYMPQEFFQQKESISIDVSKLDTTDLLNKDAILVKRIRERLKIIEDKLVEDVAKKTQKAFLDPKKVNKALLTEKEVERLKELYKENDLPKIDDFLKNLEFFRDLPLDFRNRIYKVSAVEKFEKGNKLFSQGNAASKFFLILHGKTVSNVDSEKSEFNSEYLRYTPTQAADKSLYVSLECLANCVAESRTYALTLSAYEYQQIFTDLLKQVIEDRVCFLITVPLFKGLDPTALIPLAWTLKAEVFKEGEVIQEKYQTPKGLNIIHKGYCGIYTTGYQSRSKVGNEFSNIKKRKPKPASFYTGNLKYPVRQPGSSLPSMKGKNGSFVYKTFEKVEHGVLRYGDHFGGRVLLDSNKYQNITSKYTIIAESKRVEVLVIDRQNVQNLQEKLSTHLKNALKKNNDSDFPAGVDSDVIDREFGDWQKFKQEIVEDIQRKKFVESKKIDFPFLR